jgi:hypothetical protein
LRVRGEFMNACERKVRFPDQQAALDELARIVRRSILWDRVRHHHVESGCYECPYCLGWHLTSHPRGGRIVNDLEGGAW